MAMLSGSILLPSDLIMFPNLQDVRLMMMDLFTEDEWDAIYNAMADYQDHGEEESDLAYSVQSKITALFDNN